MNTNEQIIHQLRAEIEQQVVQAQEASAYSDELLNKISRINNELVTSQRALAQQKAQLLRVNAQLQQEQERSQALLVQLKHSNQTLQDFAAIASHDLQAPLRKIESFVDHLQQNSGETLGAEGRDSLERIGRSTQQMRSFITDLLALSRVTTDAQPTAMVDLGEIAKTVMSDLEVHVQECGGRVEIGPLPSIEAEPLQMRQLLQNLISNALKFRRDGVPPIVSVTARSVTPNDIELVVKDNGIGFDEKDREHIFAPLHRLHGRQRYEGTGLGLAICQKIAERHGGSITAQSVPGHSATFIVTLPHRLHTRVAT